MTSKELETIRQNLVSAIYAVEKHGDDGIDEDDPRYEGRTAAAGRGFLYEEIRPGIRHMSADEDLQLVTHHAPGSVWSEFQDRLWREAIVGAGWALALVWKAPQQGTANRAEELRARLAVGARQKVLDILARRVISYAAAVGAELGEVPALRSARWAFSRPARLSLDDGREANAELAAVEAGQMSVSQYQAARGRTARQHFEELARERELKLEILGSDEDGSD